MRDWDGEVGTGKYLDNTILDDSSVAMGTISRTEGRDLEIYFL